VGSWNNILKVNNNLRYNKNNQSHARLLRDSSRVSFKEDVKGPAVDDDPAMLESGEALSKDDDDKPLQRQP